MDPRDFTLEISVGHPPRREVCLEFTASLSLLLSRSAENCLRSARRRRPGSVPESDLRRDEIQTPPERKSHLQLPVCTQNCPQT